MVVGIYAVEVAVPIEDEAYCKSSQEYASEKGEFFSTTHNRQLLLKVLKVFLRILFGNIYKH